MVKKIIKCDRCGFESDETKHAFGHLFVDGDNYDLCSTCHGIYKDLCASLNHNFLRFDVTLHIREIGDE